MTIEELIKTRPKARERKHKNRAIAWVVQNNYSSTNGMDIDKLTQIVGEVLTTDRKWRRLLSDNEHLRGSDYEDKKRLTKREMRNLGYL